MRFIAALIVIISHMSPLATELGFSINYFGGDLGGLGVTLFFVLSGFLITYLLFTEKRESKDIHVKKFIIRRILRIWPAYFLAVAIGFFIFPPLDQATGHFMQEHFWLKLGLFIAFLANFVRAIIYDAGVVNHLWSVCVEEQFYLTWPFIIKKFSDRFLKIAFIIIIGNILLRVMPFVWNIFHPLSDSNKTVWMICDITGKFFSWLRVDCMALGGIGAYLLIHHKAKILYIIYNPVVQLASFVLILIFMAFEISFSFFTHEVYALLFLIVILNVSSNPKSILNLENKPMNGLGKISYGLYLYHPFVYFLLLYFYHQGFGRTAYPLVNLVLINSLTVIGTILFSWLSYYYFENYFLKMKKKFTIIRSGDDAAPLSL